MEIQKNPKKPSNHVSCILTKGKYFDSSSINGVYSAHMYQVKQISERFKSGKMYTE